MKIGRRKNPKQQTAWGWYNFGMLISVERTRRDAICAVEAHTGKPWSEAKNYMEVHKVTVAKIEAEG